MNRQVTVGHMLFTVSVKDGLATWSVRPSETVTALSEWLAPENTQTKVLFSGLVTEDMGDELLKLSWVIRLAEDEAKGITNE